MRKPSRSGFQGGVQNALLQLRCENPARSLPPLRPEHFPPPEPQLPLRFLLITPHGRFSDGVLRMLVAQTHPDPMCRMPLLARCLKVPHQHLVNLFFHRTQPRRLSYHRFSLEGNRVRYRLTHHPPVHAMLLGESWIVSPAACLRRITSNSSALCLLSIPESSHPALFRWANLDERSGPIYASEPKAQEVARVKGYCHYEKLRHVLIDVGPGGSFVWGNKGTCT